MKLLKRIIAFSLCLISSLFLFSGCTYKKYELIGVVFEGDTKITLLENITDEAIKNHIKNTYNNHISIDLKSNGSYVMEYTEEVNSYMHLTYTVSGTYELNEKKETIIFYTPSVNGDLNAATNQYSNHTIIYFDGTCHLAFR